MPRAEEVVEWFIKWREGRDSLDMASGVTLWARQSPQLIFFHNVHIETKFWGNSTHIFMYFFKKTLRFYLFVWKAVLHREREETETQIFHLLVHSPDGHNDQAWARLKPGTWNSMWISNVGGRDPSTWGIFCCFLRHIIKELDQMWSSQYLS